MNHSLFCKLLLPVAVALSAVLLSGCDNEKPSVLPGEMAPEAPHGKVRRAVLVYLLSDNSLGVDGYDRENLADMIAAAKAGRLGSNRLLIYHDDRAAASPALKEVTPLGLRVLKDYGNEVSSVSPDRMKQAIADFKSVAPADKYGLILWSHATGWLQTSTPDNGVAPMWVGEDRGKYMNVTTLARVLDGEGFDYVYFDCCHMASVEALYELRGVAGKFAGSCAELPADGMPYYETLPCLMADEADLEGAARATFSAYDALSGVARTATMSVVDASALDRLAEATRSLYSLRPVIPADYAGQPFERPKYGNEPCWFFDFEDYVDALYSNNQDREMRRAYAEWLIALDDCVTYQAATPWIFNTVKVDAHCGLSTYILRRESDADMNGYRQLAWWRDVASCLFSEEQQNAQADDKVVEQ